MAIVNDKVTNSLTDFLVKPKVASLHHHVHGRQHASRALQSDEEWNRFLAGRASCSVDDQVGDATCGHGLG